MKIIRHKINGHIYRPKVMIENTKIFLERWNPDGSECTIEFQLDENYEIQLRLERVDAVSLHANLRAFLNNTITE